MANKNIIMKNHNGSNWEELYPKTAAEQITESINKRFTSDAELNGKVDKISGKQLTTEDYTSADKTKLAGIAVGANLYTHPATHSAAMITGLSTVATTGNYNDLSGKPSFGTVISKDTGTSSGTIPVIGSDGKLDSSIMPAVAITDTYTVSTQSEMLALTVQVGDVAVRTDVSKSFILKNEPAATLSNWQELLSPTSPVQSVAGKIGAVTLTSADVGLGNVTNQSKAAMFTSPSFTGTPTAPTASDNSNSTQVATTAFVQKTIQNVSSSMPKITVSAVEPSAPSAGDFWYEIV